MSMDHQIKAKAQEVRLALLGALHERIDFARGSNFPDDSIQQLAGILNQLDPQHGGLSSHVPADRIVPSLKPGDAVRVEGFDMVVNLISVGYEQDGSDHDSARRIRMDLIPAGNAGVGGYSVK